MRRRHRWIGTLVKFGLGTCRHCGTIRTVVDSFGKRRQFYIRTYLRPDGIRFTGQAPSCDSRLSRNVSQLSLLRQVCSCGNRHRRCYRFDVRTIESSPHPSKQFENAFTSRDTIYEATYAASNRCKQISQTKTLGLQAVDSGIKAIPVISSLN